jgi:hypothetical protein
METMTETSGLLYGACQILCVNESPKIQTFLLPIYPYFFIGPAFVISYIKMNHSNFGKIRILQIFKKEETKEFTSKMLQAPRQRDYFAILCPELPQCYYPQFNTRLHHG